ncbi:MAG: trypsin-like peptidase domain-containing protein [Armatimonadetes bacterium]|nr:trypsin-like peptidase domain-containing protein [Armatimonadota bacterium]
MKRSDVILILALILIGYLTYSKFIQKSEKIPEPVFSEEQVVYPEEEDNDKLEKRIQDNEEIAIARHNVITKAVELIQPAVVSVNVTKTKYVRRRLSHFFGFYDNIPYDIESIGSGVIFNKDGYIITNAHVVEGATEIKIILTDGRQIEGKLVGIDSVHDIAVVKISGKELPWAKLGNSSELIIGEWAIAVGNPYGFLIKDSKPSVSVGVISAVNRDFAENRDKKIYRRMIQTDAAINQGNSGGPLVNIYGEVIGINTFIFSESGGNIGIGFSIPINRVKKSAEELIKYGKIRKIWLDFEVQELNPMLASYLNLKDQDGILVTKVDVNSPVGKAGLKKGDIIKRINSNIISNFEDAQLAVSDIGVGEKIKFHILRDNKEHIIEVDAVEHK